MREASTKIRVSMLAAPGALQPGTVMNDKRVINFISD